MASPQVQAVGMVLNDPVSDLPEFDGPGTDYIICSTPRSGSTLLGFLLLECKMMGVPHEYLHPTIHFPALARRSGLIAPGGAVNVDDYLAWLRRRRSTANGVFGLKAHFSHISPLAHRPSVAKWVEGAHLIRIRRRDLVLQAISYYTALATGVWATVDVSTIAAAPAPDYNGRLIEKCVRALLEEDAGWSRLFAQKGLTPLDVWYEDLIATPDPVCRSVCNHVGVEPAYTFDLASVALKRLAASRAEDWKRRFCAEHQALLQTLTRASR